MHISSPQSKSGSAWPLYALILFSGAAGLVYEVVWARQLTLFIGNTAVANAAVLTAFMLGLALGSYVLGRMADRISNPLGIYALLEILIGCYGATTPWSFDLMQSAYANVAGVVGVSGSYSHIPRFLIAIIAMLIPTFLMGGTLPLLVKYFAGQLEQAQAATSRIYGINTLGATLGAFCAGFMLLPNLGISLTLLVAAGINVIVGLGVYHLLSRAGQPVFAFGGTSRPVAMAEGTVSLDQPYLLLFGFGLSGFAALLYQIVWIHSLILVIGVSIYAFSTVLTVYLAGIGLGSLWVGRKLHYISVRHSLKTAFFLQLGIALSAIVSLSLTSQLPIMFVQGWALFKDSFPLFQAYTFLLAGIVIFVPTLLLGALFPLITGLWSRWAGGVGRGVGEAYGVNALGTIVGSAFGGLFLLDWIGLEGSLYLASAISLIVAILFWYLSNPEPTVLNRWVLAPLAALTVVATAVVLPGWDRDALQALVFRRSDEYMSEDIRAAIYDQMKETDFLYYKEGIHGTVSVISRVSESGQRTRTLLNNGKADASSHGDMDTQVLSGQLPMFLHGSPREVMVIGLGSGVTAGSVLQKSTVENVDVLEISPEIVEASYYFRDINYDVLNHPKTNLILADARNYLLASPKKYDVIISEPSHSWVTGVSNLFTREFLQLANDRLHENGILVQWYHLYGVDQGSVKALLRAVSEVFPHFTLWGKLGGDLLIVSSNEPLSLDYQEHRSLFNDAKIEADLSRIGIQSMEQLFSHLLMSSAEARPLLSDQKANTDEFPIVEFNAPKHLYQATAKDNILMLFDTLSDGEYRLPVTGLVKADQNWLAAPYMGVQLRHDGSEYSDPEWHVVRKAQFNRAGDDFRLLTGMKGKITLKKSWGDVVVHATMGKRSGKDMAVLDAMLDYEIPDSDNSEDGELRAPGITIYWRIGMSEAPGKLKAVVAQKCEKQSRFDSWVSLASIFPGYMNNREDIGTAVKQLNSQFRCLP